MHESYFKRAPQRQVESDGGVLGEALTHRAARAQAAELGSGGGSTSLRSDQAQSREIRFLVQRRGGELPVDAPVEQLARLGTRGAGGRLPYHDQIQRAFGRHDIGGIRSHSDRAAGLAARSLNARAYATGADIAFAGQPDLHTAAHEAAHVVQQRAGVHLSGGVGRRGDPYEKHADTVADQVVRGESAETLLDELPASGGGASQGAVQRAWGMEFETGIPVWDNETLEKLPYKELIVGHSGWHVEADSSSLELVTDPFGLSFGQRRQMLGVIREMVGWLDDAKSSAAQEEDGAPFIASWDAGVKNDDLVIDMTGQEHVLCAPQATGGFTLEQLPELLGRVGGEQLDFLADGPVEVPEEDRNMSGMFNPHGEMLSAAVGKARAWMVMGPWLTEDLPDHRYQKLFGLLSLVISYLDSGAAQEDRWSYSKIIAPVMSRMNFSLLYEQLEEDEKAQFTVENVMEAAGLDPSGYVFAVGFGKKGEPGGEGPKRGEWIESILTSGPDLMSAGGGSSVADYEQATSGTATGLGEYAELAEPDKEGDPKLALMELRRLPKVVGYRQWEDLAKAVYRFFRSIHVKSRDTV